ncbi:MAG: TIGR00725 family protein [Syntrophobacterales bacterium]|nr:TIGR00725 family protein [Syntrophobacterales bacterium]
MGVGHRSRYVAVIGAGEASVELETLAREVGRRLAEAGAVLLCGGLGGVMAAAARGAREAGGVSIGILPGPDRRGANPFLTFALPTNLGHARNMIIAHAADALIAVGGSYGTISEAAIGLKLGKLVLALAVDWHLPGLRRVESPAAAVQAALGLIPD